MATTTWRGRTFVVRRPVRPARWWFPRCFPWRRPYDPPPTAGRIPSTFEPRTLHDRGDRIKRGVRSSIRRGDTVDNSGQRQSDDGEADRATEPEGGKQPRPREVGGGFLMGRPFGVPVYVSPSW